MGAAAKKQQCYDECKGASAAARVPAALDSSRRSLAAHLHALLQGGRKLVRVVRQRVRVNYDAACGPAGRGAATRS
jgi:hypothetical protein